MDPREDDPAFYRNPRARPSELENRLYRHAFDRTAHAYRTCAPLQLPPATRHTPPCWARSREPYMNCVPSVAMVRFSTMGITGMKSRSRNERHSLIITPGSPSRRTPSPTLAAQSIASCSVALDRCSARPGLFPNHEVRAHPHARERARVGLDSVKRAYTRVCVCACAL
ncbi:hypothetical protein BV20DRAFT_90366 [Pilatotrama ljubarskyi]|nr:hypothetical protein BV20DRAFT_90366 [Pilatotrama ljubarskyi]